MTILENVPLASCTTLGVGGPARWFADAKTSDEIAEALRFARIRAAPYFILGGGSNLLVSDDGFPGLVIRIASDELDIGTSEPGGVAVVRAGAGVAWDSVVSAAVEKGAAGIECLAGIPGLVGGTPVQNVGAYGQEVSNTIRAVHAIDLATERSVRFSQAECGFAYRRSIFNTTHSGRYAITHVLYELKLSQQPHLAYRDLQQYFAERGIAQPSLTAAAEAVRAIRARKGMVLDAGDPDSRSAGSFFKNPIAAAASVPRLAAIANCLVADVPQFPPGSEYVPGDQVVKLSAAWLIERAGFHKGYSMGRAGLSSKHVLAIVNRGGATASEIVALRNAIVKEVQVRFNIVLEQEPVMLGFDYSR